MGLIFQGKKMIYEFDGTFIDRGVRVSKIYFPLSVDGFSLGNSLFSDKNIPPG